MPAEEDFEAYRRQQLEQVREIQVTSMGLQSFEKGLVRIIVRSEGGSQELKVNELELQEIRRAAGSRIMKKIPELAALKLAIRDASIELEQVTAKGTPVEIMDALANEVTAWREYAQALEARMSFPGGGLVPVSRNTLTYAATALEGSSDNGDRYAARQIREAISAPHGHITITDSAGAPLYEIETTPMQPEDFLIEQAAEQAMKDGDEQQ